MSIKTMPVWKWVLLLIASFILALVMYAFSQLASDAVKPDFLKWFVSIIVSVVMIALYAVFVQWFEKQPAKDIPLRKIPADTGKGLAIGAVFMLAVTLIMMLCGLYRIDAVRTDDPIPLVTAFFLFLYVAVGEEILFRGVLFRWIDEKWGFIAALVVSALLFGSPSRPDSCWARPTNTAERSGCPSASIGPGTSCKAISSVSKYPAATPGIPC